MEDGRSSGSLEAESATSDQPRDQSEDQDPESQSQDGIFLDRIASMSLDMSLFEPSDFTGRFTKFQSRSRKRTRIIKGRTVTVLHLVQYVVY